MSNNISVEFVEVTQKINKNLYVYWFAKGYTKSGAYAYIEVTYNQRTGKYGAKVVDGNNKVGHVISSGEIQSAPVMEKVKKFFNKY